MKESISLNKQEVAIYLIKQLYASKPTSHIKIVATAHNKKSGCVWVLFIEKPIRSLANPYAGLILTYNNAISIRRIYQRMSVQSFLNQIRGNVQGFSFNLEKAIGAFKRNFE